MTSQASSSASTQKIILISLRPLKVKSFQNTATYQKLRGGLPSTPPLYHDGGMDLLVRLRVKNFIEKQLQRFRYRFIEHSFGSFLGKILRWDRPCANKSVSIFHHFVSILPLTVVPPYWPRFLALVKNTIR